MRGTKDRNPRFRHLLRTIRTSLPSLSITTKRTSWCVSRELKMCWITSSHQTQIRALLPWPNHLLTPNHHSATPRTSWPGSSRFRWKMQKASIGAGSDVDAALVGVFAAAVQIRSRRRHTIKNAGSVVPLSGSAQAMMSGISRSSRAAISSRSLSLRFFNRAICS